MIREAMPNPPQTSGTIAGKIRAALELVRPHNCLISGLSIWIAAWLARPIHSYASVVFAILSGMFLTAGANVINDWYDIEIDRINRPKRPLPSGRLSAPFALRFAIILFVCGVIFSIFIGKIAVIIAITSVFFLVSYSAYFKRTAVWGNAVVSFMTALAFVYGALAAGQWKDGLIPATFAFLFHFGREIIKDLDDVAGDAAMSARTLPIRYGARAAYLWVTVIYGLLILMTFVPYAAKMYGKMYLAVVVVGVDTVLIAVLIALWRQKDALNLRRINAILKLDMLIGLLAISLG